MPARRRLEPFSRVRDLGELGVRSGPQTKKLAVGTDGGVVAGEIAAAAAGLPPV